MATLPPHPEAQKPSKAVKERKGDPNADLSKKGKAFTKLWAAGPEFTEFKESKPLARHEDQREKKELQLFGTFRGRNEQTLR